MCSVFVAKPPTPTVSWIRQLAELFQFTSQYYFLILERRGYRRYRNLGNINRKWDIPGGLDYVNDYGYVLTVWRKHEILASINHIYVPQIVAYG
jgi:hypothetical protein